VTYRIAEYIWMCTELWWQTILLGMLVFVVPVVVAALVKTEINR
jgi:hypothetical protein